MRNKTSKSLICRHCTLTPTLSLEGRGSKGLAVTPFFSPRTPGADRGLGCSQFDKRPAAATSATQAGVPGAICINS